MRWKHKSFDEKIKRAEAWHKWFAWYPVVVEGEKVWMETIYRRFKIYRGPGTDVWEAQYTDTLGLLKYKQKEQDYDGLE